VYGDLLVAFKQANDMRSILIGEFIIGL
jgi:hypothetical protein